MFLKKYLGKIGLMDIIQLDLVVFHVRTNGDKCAEIE